MPLQKIQGHTYYYPNSTNIGVLRSKSGLSLLIDAGIDSSAGRGLAQALDAEGLKAKYVVLTHAHPDHFGAVKWLKEQFTGLIRYASEGEALWMMHPHLESQAMYGATPLKELENRFLKGPKIEIDEFLKPGVTEIGDKRLEIFPLPGHTYDQLGVLTGDSVLFAGDSLFSEEIMLKYGFPFLLDIERQLETIERIRKIEADYVVLSHADQVYSSIYDLCDQNKSRIEDFLEKILKLCDQPMTREDVTEQILLATGMEVDVSRYQMTFATVGAFISYLANGELIAKSIIGGKCYFYRE